MRKFTVFTVILTILVVVVSAETFVNKYLPSLTKADISSPNSVVDPEDKFSLPTELKIGNDSFENVSSELNDKSTKVLGNSSVTENKTTKIMNGTTAQDGAADLNSGLLGVGNVTPDLFDEGGVVYSQVKKPSGVDTQNSSPSVDPNLSGSVSSSSSLDIEDFSGSTSAGLKTAYLSDTMVVNSGFTGGYLEAEPYDGVLYKTIDTTDLKGIKIEKYNVTDGTVMFAKIYIVSFDGTTTLEDTYNVLKLRVGQTADVQINETNDFGLGSFYMNDVRRSGVAFLTVKISDKIYGFTYPKQYHPQIKNLISLLALGTSKF